MKKQMLLGKRPRPPMKRTTSMSEIITFDLNTPNDVDPNNTNPLNCQGPEGEPASGFNGFIDLDQSRVLATVSPRNHTRRHFEDFAHTPDFLRTCSLCKRRLVHGRDIYMYRYTLLLTLPPQLDSILVTTIFFFWYMSPL